jgi:hypothetical protein
MMKWLVILLFAPISAFALFEARVTYTGLVGKDALSQACGSVCTGTVPGMLPLYGLGADALVEIPMVPFGFGLRYEKTALSASTSSITADANLTRTALLVNYRLLDTIVHVGPIFSFGLSHSGGIKISQNGGALLDYTSDKGESATLGLEVGVVPLIVIPIKVGAEAGLSHIKLKDAKDALGNASKDIDLSGYYLKIFLGLDI